MNHLGRAQRYFISALKGRSPIENHEMDISKSVHSGCKKSRLDTDIILGCACIGKQFFLSDQSIPRTGDKPVHK